MNERGSGWAAGEHDGRQGPRFQRMELKYCERCGALGIQRAHEPGLEEGTANQACNACKASLQWLAGEVRR